MSALLLAALIAAGFEVLWLGVPSLHRHRWHFRAMLAFFWATVLAIFIVDRLGVAPGLFFEGIPRFASDAATYQRQARMLAEGLRDGSISVFVDRQAFNYSRLLAVLYFVFGDRALVGNVFNAVFYMASLLSIFFISRQLFSERVGLWAAWMFALWPTFLLHETQTLRWGTTTAALHLAVLGAVLLVSRASWQRGFLLAVMGFGVLVNDLPYIARLFIISVVAFAIMAMGSLSLGRARFLVSARLVMLALFAGTWYQLSWVESGALPSVAASFYVAPYVPPPSPGAPHSAGKPSSVREPSSLGASSSPSGSSSPDASTRDKPRVSSLSERIAARLDALIYPALSARAGFVNDARTLRRAGIPVGTAIDGAHLETFGDFIRNLPAAYGIALFEPTIPRLLDKNGGSSRVSHLAVLEIAVYYVVIAVSFVGLVLAFRAGGTTRAQSIFILLLMAGVYALLGTTILNGGTLHRLRQPYVAFHCIFAAAVLSACWTHVQSTAWWRALMMMPHHANRVEVR